MPDPVINARFGLDAGPFRRGMADVRNQTRRAETGIRRASRATRQFRRVLGALGIGVGVGAIAGLARRAINMADDFAKAADSVGTTTDEIQKLRFAEEQTVQTQGALENGLKRLGRRMVDQEKQFNELGIAVRDADGNFLSVRDGLDQVADAIQNADSQAERLNIAQRALGTEGRALVPLLQQGSEGLARFGREAEESGRILDEDTVRALENAKQTMDDFSRDATIGMARVIDKIREANKGIADLVVGMDSSAASSEAEARQMQARAQAIREFREAGQLTMNWRGEFGVRQESEIPGVPGRVDTSPIDRRTEEILTEMAQRASLAEKIAREAAEARGETEEAADESARKARSDFEQSSALREVARTIGETIRQRQTQDLPLSEQILSLEKRIAQAREEAAAATTEDDRIDQINRLLDLEDELNAKRRQAADLDRQRRERLAPTLAQVAETETPAGRIARWIQEGEDAARQARISGFEPGGIEMDRPEAPRTSDRRFAGLRPQERADAFREAQRDFARDMEEFAERQRGRLRGLIPDSEADPFEDMRKSSRESAQALKEILEEMRQEEVA